MTSGWSAADIYRRSRSLSSAARIWTCPSPRKRERGWPSSKRPEPPTTSPTIRTSTSYTTSRDLTDARGHRREPAQRRFGRRPCIRGGEQERQARVCPQLGGLEDEVERAHERVLEPVQACGWEAHVVLCPDRPELGAGLRQLLDEL